MFPRCRLCTRVAVGLMRAGLFAFPLEVMRIVCLPGGLAERHFDWPTQMVTSWRRNLVWYLPVGLALVAAIGMAEGSADEHRMDSFGRLTFMTFALLSALFSQRTVRRANQKTATSEGVAADDTDVWSDRFWRWVPRLAVVTSLGLFALGWAGYFYSALQLNWRLQGTVILAVGLLLLRASIRRWIALRAATNGRVAG